MIVAIAGLSGAGKNTVGGEVARLLGIREVQISFKNEAQKLGIPLMEMQNRAGKDPKIDEALDAAILAEVSKGDCVVMTWLGPWKVKDATLRVWLEADDETRAKRISGRDKMTYEEALDHVRKRDPGNVRRYKEYYGIDILDHSNFDLVVNTSHFNPIDAAKIIALAAKMPKLPKNE